ncbi:Phospholipase A-2-activating protein (PLA2P) (PLAP), partial [Durusdinium trenchii]
MDVDFELSQQLQGHESQVRCLALLSDGALVSGGLDSQVIIWRRPSEEEGFIREKTLKHHTDFVFALAPSHSEKGSFYSGSKDRLAFKCDREGNPCIQFQGHEGPVCSIVEIGAKVVTGAWDGTAKVWDITNGTCLLTLEAGAHAVAVATLPTGEIVTGSQDKTLRVFRGESCVHKVDEAHGDIIRHITASSTGMATASNDGSVKLWSFDGLQMSVLGGHQSYVYGVAFSGDNSEIISASDDSTLKVWSVNDSQCKQSIVHAGTVWQAIPLPNSDIITACADMIVRVWTRDPARMAAEAERQTQQEIAQQAAVAAAQKGSSSVPMDSVIDISRMPTMVGKKNGDVKMFNDNGTVFAYMWNAGARCWDKVGEVMGAPKPAKVFYEGDSVFPSGEYDFVWDVDMGPSMGTKKLPFNRGQNPLQAAESFCSREQIHKGNMDQIRAFIEQNAGDGASGAAPAAPAAPAPAPTAYTEPSMEFFPVLQPAVFKDGKFEALQGKILEFNQQVEEELRLDPVDTQHLIEGISKLKMGVSTELRDCEKEIIVKKLGKWPNDKLFPVVDLWRLLLAHPSSSDFFKGSDRGTSYILQVLNLLAVDINSPLGLCAARYLANLFIYQTNKYAAFDKRELVLNGVEAAISSTNKHTKLACASVLLNMAIILYESSQPPKAFDEATANRVLQLALTFLSKVEDEDARCRAMLAIG